MWMYAVRNFVREGKTGLEKIMAGQVIILNLCYNKKENNRKDSGSKGCRQRGEAHVKRKENVYLKDFIQ